MAKIFLMEDSPPLRRVLVRQIRDAGHTVAAFENGEQSKNTGIVGDADVLITDLSMPGVDGEMVIRTVSRLRPSLPIIVISASIPQAIADMKAVDIVLTKPFSERKLVDAIDTALKKPSRAESNDESHNATPFREKQVRRVEKPSESREIKRRSRFAKSISYLLKRGRQQTSDSDEQASHSVKHAPNVRPR